MKERVEYLVCEPAEGNSYMVRTTGHDYEVIIRNCSKKYAELIVKSVNGFESQSEKLKELYAENQALKTDKGKLVGALEKAECHIKQQIEWLEHIYPQINCSHSIKMGFSNAATDGTEVLECTKDALNKSKDGK